MEWVECFSQYFELRIEIVYLLEMFKLLSDYVLDVSQETLENVGDSVATESIEWVGGQLEVSLEPHGVLVGQAVLFDEVIVTIVASNFGDSGVLVVRIVALLIKLWINYEILGVCFLMFERGVVRWEQLLLLFEHHKSVNVGYFAQLRLKRLAFSAINAIILHLFLVRFEIITMVLFHL